MTNSNTIVGRPIVRGRNGSKETLHCRVPEEMKAHWAKFVEDDPDYDTVTDLVIDVLNEKTGYQE